MSWARSTCTAHHLLHLPLVLWMRVLSYLPASQTITLSRLMQQQRHRRYYSGVDYRFPVAAGSRDGEQEERKSEEEAVEEERKEQEWGILSVDSLYDVDVVASGSRGGDAAAAPKGAAADAVRWMIDGCVAGRSREELSSSSPACAACLTCSGRQEER